MHFHGGIMKCRCFFRVLFYSAFLSASGFSSLASAQNETTYWGAYALSYCFGVSPKGKIILQDGYEQKQLLNGNDAEFANLISQVKKDSVASARKTTIKNCGGTCARLTCRTVTRSFGEAPECPAGSTVTPGNRSQSLGVALHIKHLPVPLNGVRKRDTLFAGGLTQAVTPQGLENLPELKQDAAEEASDYFLKVLRSNKLNPKTVQRSVKDYTRWGSFLVSTYDCRVPEKPCPNPNQPNCGNPPQPPVKPEPPLPPVKPEPPQPPPATTEISFGGVDTFHAGDGAFGASTCQAGIGQGTTQVAGVYTFQFDTLEDFTNLDISIGSLCGLDNEDSNFVYIRENASGAILQSVELAPGATTASLKAVNLRKGSYSLVVESVNDVEAGRDDFVFKAIQIKGTRPLKKGRGFSTAQPDASFQSVRPDSILK